MRTARSFDSRGRRWWSAAALCLAVTVLGSAPVAAQGGRWGLEASFTPQWTGQESLTDTFYDLGGWELEGHEFTVGIVRGSDNGGNWGISYVRKPLEDGLRHVITESWCEAPICSSTTFDRVMQSVAVQGVEAHWFIPVARFASRVQVGLNLGAGAGFPAGTIAETVTARTTFEGQAVFESVEHFDLPAKDVLYGVVPLARAEVQIAVRAAKGLKLKVSGGLNAPSAAAVRVGIVYLFGA